MRFRKAESKTVALSIIASLIIATIVPYAILSLQPRSEFDLATVMEDDANAKIVMDALNRYYEKEQEEANQPQKVEGVSADDDPFLGSADAPVTIVEFTEYECPYCQRHSQQVLPEIKENYIDTGKVKYVVRDFIVHGESSLTRSMAAECVRAQGGDTAYFEYHDLLFGEAFSTEYDDLAQGLADLAGEIDGIDTAQVAECIAAGTYSQEVMADTSAGRELGVSGTPNMFVNGWHVNGAYPYETFVELIEAELAAQE